LLAHDSIECPTVTSAGTGTFEFETGSGSTELQCGSDIFMDADYGRDFNRDGAPTKTFEPSLSVWATVMSRPAEDRAIVDAGLKALAFDSGPPLVCDEPAATYERASDEHGRLAVSAATNRLALGDKIRLIPGHCDPTVNLYDWYVCIRNNCVEQLWPITARGAVYQGSSLGHGEAGLPRDVSRLPHAERCHGCGSCSLRRDTGSTLMSASCWRACARS
jgi:3-hydroxy-D-aspartate aldolase